MLATQFVVWPVLLPLITAGLTLLPGFSRNTRRVMASFSAVLQLALAIYLLYTTTRLPEHASSLVLVVGGWPAAFGIALVIDSLAAIMLCLSAIVVLMSLVFGFFTTPADKAHPLRIPLVQLLATGMHLAFITGDLFNLFVAFEVMLLASYALLTAEVDDQDVRHAFPYVSINLFGSAIFLVAAGYCYGILGTLNFAEIAARADTLGDDPRLTVLASLFMVVFGIKSALFPLFYWLPHSYPVLPSAVAALYSGMLTKVGVYAFLRLFATVLPHNQEILYDLLAWLAAATMLFGVLGAVSRDSMREILSFHIISQIGFMLLALGFFTKLAVIATVLYVIHHIIVKSSLFLVAGVVATLNRSDQLNKMGGIWNHAPMVGIVFLLQAFSLAGIPPLSGFWGKLLIIMEGFATGRYVLVTISILASILTLYSMLKIWNMAFWRDNPEDSELRIDDRRWPRLTALAGLMATVSLCIGLLVEPVYKIAEHAGNGAMNRAAYIELVRGSAK